MQIRSKKLIVSGFILLVLSLIGISFPLVFNFIINFQPLLDVTSAQVPTFGGQFVSAEQGIPQQTGIKTDYERADIKDRLVIPSIGVNMPIFLGANEKILNKGGWLFPTTSRPDLGGNSVIFGHRYKYLPPIANTLYSLDKINIGDEMVVYWQGQKYVYKVFEKKVIEPTDLSVIQPTQNSQLSVITCTPLFTTKQRLVVAGSLVSN